MNPRGLYSGLELILFNNELGGVLTPTIMLMREQPIDEREIAGVYCP